MIKYYNRLLALSSIIDVEDEYFLTIKDYFREISEGTIIEDEDYTSLYKDNYYVAYNKKKEYLIINGALFEDCKILFNTDNSNNIKDYIIMFLNHFDINLHKNKEVKYLLFLWVEKEL